MHVAPAPAPTQPNTAKGGKSKHKGKGAGPPQRGSVQVGGRGKGKGAAPASPCKVAGPSKPREGPSTRGAAMSTYFDTLFVGMLRGGEVPGLWILHVCVQTC